MVKLGFFIHNYRFAILMYQTVHFVLTHGFLLLVVDTGSRYASLEEVVRTNVLRVQDLMEVELDLLQSYNFLHTSFVFCLLHLEGGKANSRSTHAFL